MRVGRILFGLTVAALACTGLTQGAQSVEQADEWAWLEDVHGDKAMAWVKEHNALTLATLKADPAYQDDYDRILALLDAKDRIPYASLWPGKAYNFWQDAEHPKGIWRVTTPEDYERAEPHWQTLLDVDALAAAEKENWVYGGALISPDQTRALVYLSRGGGDAHVVREYDLAHKRFLPDGFQLAEAKGGASYVDNNSILYETDFGPGSMTKSGYPRIVKFWRRGEPIAAAKTIFEGNENDIGVSGSVIWPTPHSHIAMIVRSPSFFESEYFLIRDDLSTVKLPLPLSVRAGSLLHDQLTLWPREDWTYQGKTYKAGSALSFSLSHFRQTGELGPLHVLLAPGPRMTIGGGATTAQAMYLTVFENVAGRVLRFTFSHGVWVSSAIPLPLGGTPYVAAADSWGSRIQFGYNDYLQPPTLYASDGIASLRAIKALPARFDASGLVAEQFEVASKDGTMIPYSIVHAKDAKGPRPTILYGYGGFEISQTPGYLAGAGMLWLSKGGNYVVANIRGGGEFGPAWHDAALKQNRQRAFDDFAAVAADLAARGFTTPKQLGIMGGSNGGLLVATVMVQHPELLGAVVCQVPLLDMIAYTHIGAGASWVAEYGDPADPAARDYILKYSPYQNVRADVHYPPAFFITATSDDRVTPVHARKMAARMLAQGHEVMFYENTDGGHSAAADHAQAAEKAALTFVYLQRRLGLQP